MVDLAALVYLLAFGCAFHVPLRYTLTPGAKRRPPPRLRRPPPPAPDLNTDRRPYEVHKAMDASRAQRR